jgi:hypothetical protein
MDYLYIVYAALLVLPFVCWWAHIVSNKVEDKTITLYRYFLLFNMFVPALFIGLRILLGGAHMAEYSGFFYAPIYTEFAVTMIAIGIMGFITLFCRGNIIVAPGILWVVFLAGIATTHLIQLIYSAHSPLFALMTTHVVYEYLVLIITFVLLSKMKYTRCRLSSDVCGE